MNYLEQLNKMHEFAEEQGFTYPTDYAFIQDNLRYSQIVTPNGMKDAGTIRSLQEVNNYLDKRFGEKAIHLSEEEYKDALKSLYDKLKDEGYTNKQGFMHAQREKLTNIVEAMNEYLDTDYSVVGISTKRLNEIVKQAGDITATLPKGDSSSFYEILEELLESERGE